jgi:hypothetical protein
VANRAGLEKREPSVHGEHEDRAHQQEKDVGSRHAPSPLFIFCAAVRSAPRTAQKDGKIQVRQRL